MIKKLLLIVVALTIVLSAITSVFGAPVQSSNIESAETSAVTSASGAATWLMLTPTKDTSLSEASPDLNLGSNPNLYLQGNGFWNNRNSRYNIALEFNLNAVPKNAVITSATLSMYLHYCDEYDTASPAVSCGRQPHPDWVENEATFNVYKTGSNWGSPGGDWFNDGLSSLGELAPTYRGWIDFDVKTIVEDSLNLSIPAEFLVRAVRAESNYQFWSKEGDSWLGPKLEIEYTTDGTPNPTPTLTPTPTPTPTPTATPWSFVIITDLHVGENATNKDFGASGWDDNGNYSNSTNDKGLHNLRISVSKINKGIEGGNPDNIKFVVVLGDLTANAELSEMQAAKDALNQLKVPWLPIIGNHDIWPYTKNTEFPKPTSYGDGSDKYFNDWFYSAYQNFSTKLGLPSTWKEPTPALNNETNPNFYSYFQNFAFDYGGFHFIGLDFNARSHAPVGQKGVGGWADLYDFSGGTWSWLKQHLTDYLSNSDNRANGKNIIILSHHTFVCPYYGFLLPGHEEVANAAMGFTSGERSTITDFLKDYKDYLNIQFSGHWHPGDPDPLLPPSGRNPLSKDLTRTYRCYLLFPCHEKIIPCVAIPGNLNIPWFQIVKLKPSDKTIDYSKDSLHAITYRADCPVELTVTDPDNLVINKDINQIPEAMYITSEYDENGNSSPCHLVWIPDRKPGNYSIQVVPDPNANASDTFTLTASPSEDKWGYTPILIAQNVTISNIPSEPYTFEVKQRTTTNLSYIGALSDYNFETINLTAVLSTENGSPLSGKTVKFVIGNQSVSAVTDVNGLATASLTLNQTYSGLYDIEYGFDGDTGYLPYYDYQLFVIPPVADAGGPYTGSEGSPVTLNGSDTYDPEGRAISYAWDLDNDGVYDNATGVTPAYTWNDDYSDSIRLRVTDDSGTISIATATVTINNVLPTVEAGADINNAIAGTAINFNGSFTDPGTLDTHTIEWNFGDGSPTVNGTLTPAHTYTSSGNYIVTLTVTDDDGGVGTDTLVINIMPATTTYTFATGGGINKWCREGHVHLINWNCGHPTSPTDFANSYGYVAGGTSAYSAISSSDNVWWKSNISHDLGCCAFDRNCELFTFKIAENPSTITNIKIKWEGHGTTGEIIYYTTEKLWKASNNTWNTLNNKMNITSDTLWTNNISSNCSDYIDATGNLSVLIAAQRSGLPNNCGIWTDYIEVSITHN